MTDDSLYNKVLFIGPHLSNRGGISTVLNTYRRHIPGFRFLATNSVKGLIPGLINFSRTVALLPFCRLFSGIRILDINTSSGKSWRRKSIIARLGKLLGFKVVIHIHSGQFKEFAEKRGVKSVVSVLKKCDRTVFLSEEWNRYAVGTLGLTNSRVLNNPIDIPVTIPERQFNTRLPIRFLYLGAFLPIKGIFDLLETVAEHREELRGKMILTLCGNYNEDKVKDFIKTKGIGDLADFRGWISGEEKLSVMASNDIHVQPSHFEGMPLSVLEAMSYSMPVIAGRVGAVPEITEEGGNAILITPGDKDALFSAMMYYIQSPELIERHGSRGQLLSQSFRPERIISRLTDILKEVE